MKSATKWPRFNPNSALVRQGHLPLLHNLHRTVIITVITMRMVQVAVDEVVDVIPVGDRFVTASRTMNVPRIMLAAVVSRGAFRRIDRTHRDYMLFDDPVISHPVQMAIVKIIRVIFVLNCSVPTSGAMNVTVVVMRVIRHANLHLIAIVFQIHAPSPCQNQERSSSYRAYNLSTIVLQR
jgi:hypothetical protein